MPELISLLSVSIAYICAKNVQIALLAQIFISRPPYPVRRLLRQEAMCPEIFMQIVEVILPRYHLKTDYLTHEKDPKYAYFRVYA